MSKPSRKVVTRSPKRSVGLVNCRWVQSHPIAHESRLEKHFVLRAILYPALRTVQHQPFKLQLAGRTSYTPDFLLTFTNGQRAVVEVKRSEKIKEIKDRLNEIARRLAERDFAYFVVHQVQIEGQKIAERACLLRRYATLAVPASLAEAAAATVAAHPKGVRIGQLCREHRMKQEQLFALLAKRLIAVNHRLLLSNDDIVLPITKEVSHAADQFGSWFGCAPWKPNA